MGPDGAVGFLYLLNHKGFDSGHTRMVYWLFLLQFKSEFDNKEFIISEKAMTPHSSTLAWKIPWMEEPGRL